MPHEQTVRLIPGAKNAVLFMHGIAGTPDHFRTLLPLEDMVPADWSVYNVLMPGHGGRVEDFSCSSMKQWQEKTMEIFRELCSTHERVVLVGHSMGTLFSIRMALERPEKVPFLFLIAVPLRVGVKLFGVCNLIRFAFGALNADDPVQEATSRVCSIRPSRMVWKYAGWLPRIWELICQMHATAKVLSRLEVPAYAWQSRRDELVSLRSGKLLRESGKIREQTLQRSTHFYYHPEDISLVRETFGRLLSEL